MGIVSGFAWVYLGMFEYDWVCARCLMCILCNMGDNMCEHARRRSAFKKRKSVERELLKTAHVRDCCVVCVTI